MQHRKKGEAQVWTSRVCEHGVQFRPVGIVQPVVKGDHTVALIEIAKNGLRQSSMARWRFSKADQNGPTLLRLYREIGKAGGWVYDTDLFLGVTQDVSDSLWALDAGEVWTFLSAAPGREWFVEHFLPPDSSPTLPDLGGLWISDAEMQQLRHHSTGVVPGDFDA